MNCETARNRLMALPDPAVVPEGIAAHLDVCHACQMWHRLLTRVEEGIVATAPAAHSDGARRQLIARFRDPEPIVNPVIKTRPASGSKVLAPVRPASARRSVGERLARLWPAGLVAAALLLGVLVWSSLQKPEAQSVAALPPDPFLDKAVAAKVKLDAAPDAVARLAVLDSLQQSIREEATSLSKVTPGSDMESLARMYEQVVADGMVEQARLLSDDEKKARLPEYQNRLAIAQQEANRLAAEAPVGADRPLKDIARAAEKGRTELARMIQG
jgi:hypothetical protein